ncbi:hypothetical protein METBIDRAFT_48003 [Metschnikowia bicuspidata var. bicuspidata NRRL YB-4993]|uniref:SNF2-family ATP dependent chromatin remodeling factor snf21 n=1 Tax=Metschnikowia bicuspidata var. bicuspidata NRRL YB-4993 TaxID=869754 RepID=A0A1A0GZA5_9ASCO|nr:hypothetical protein METBIDRAFT_48003 [Metschnikowia bicuspidata var. bicuspidata NRRL YB-4993]OBA17025.1 hypothetical protein METBIDRAFT_48003 [Metschnikowia bicuspidata var. bicuspidata NRRL YB-4993]
MNRQPTREEVQRYIQRWQQLKAQYGSDAVNVPEYTQLTKLIRYIQAQALQRQQQVQTQQQHQQPQQQPQNQQQQQQQHQQQPQQIQQQQQQIQQQQIQQQQIQQQQIQQPAPDPAMLQVTHQPAGFQPHFAPKQLFVPVASTMGSAMSNSGSSLGTPVMGAATAQMGVPPLAAVDFARGGPDPSPFTPQQMEVLRLQHQAAKFLFRSLGGFAPVPQGLIDVATNERMAFSNNSAALAGAPGSGSQSPQVPLQQAAPAAFARQSQVPMQPPPALRPDAHQLAAAPQMVALKRHAAKSQTPQQQPGSGTPAAAAAADPNHIQPVSRLAAVPREFAALAGAEDLSGQLVIPVSKPGAQVDAFVLPTGAGPGTGASVPFSALYASQGKSRYPSLLPYGINFSEIASSREHYISLMIHARISDLARRLAAAADAAERDLLTVEITQLKLLPHQKAVRGRVLSQMWFSKALLPNSHPNFLAKFPELLIENVLATELLYKQQLYSVVQAKNKRHHENVARVLAYTAGKKERLHGLRERLERLAIKVNSFHAQTAKEEQKKSERMAKQRLQALKLNDEEAYLKLLDHTKDTRITHLLNQTNQFLDTLAQAVQTQQRESASKAPHLDPSEALPEPGADEAKHEKVDYYQVAHRVTEEVTKQPSLLVGGQLKEYQIKGLQWMVSLFNNHLNGILADEMGLGKTIQTISLLAYLIETKNVSGPFLVIVPLSTLTNWNIEFEKWAPSIKKITYKGTPVQRKVMQNDIKQNNFQVLLTTFEYIIKDKGLLAKIKWVHMIIDEGHRMKNAQSKLSETLTHFYHSDYRLILTGTPLQNNLPELWALLNFVLPKIFNSVKSFDEWFNTPFANTGGQDKIELSEEETLLVIRRLHKVLRPFLLRRLKKDVEKDLPNKVEKVVKCKMSSLQSKLYQMMLKYNALIAGDSGNGKKASTIKNANNQLMQLRKICNHPFVYEEVENLINPNLETNDCIWRTAGKFELLDRILPKFKMTGHRVLIFFQMTQIMDIMEDFLRLRDMKYMRLDGGTKSDDRTTLLKLFNAPGSDYFCFLLSTRAGGLGLNLQSADTVIIFDSDWNPHQDLQAQDRAHRIGQKNEVRILRLITEDSIEEMILERAVAKLEIDGKVIQAGKFDNKSTSEEQEALLRALLEKEEERRQKSNEEDQDLDDDELNQIIARNTNELDVFRDLDSRRAFALREADYPSRLFTELELPEIYKKDPRSMYKSEQQLIEEYGRGNRERKTAIYDDNLTEEEWLKRIEGTVSDDSSEEVVVRKKGRPRKIDVEKRKMLGLDDESLAKRPRVATPSTRGKRGKVGRPRLKTASNRTTPSVDVLAPETRALLQERMEKIMNALLDFSDGERRLSDLFLVKPSKKLYPDYYISIKHPIALDVIRKRIGNKTYMQMRDYLEDIHLIFSNARMYNEEGSIVYRDALTLENLAIEIYKRECPEEMSQWDTILDFTSFDEVHQYKPLAAGGIAIKQPVTENNVNFVQFP